MRFLFSKVLTFCHIINYGSKHALNTQRKTQQHSLNICVYYAHFPCGMNVPFKNTIGGKPLQMKSIPPILLSISHITLFLDCRLRRSEKLLKISKVSYAWKTYRKHFSRSLDFVEIIPRPRLAPL